MNFNLHYLKDKMKSEKRDHPKDKLECGQKRKKKEKRKEKKEC